MFAYTVPTKALLPLTATAWNLIKRQGVTNFYLPPSDNISSFPLYNVEVLTTMFPCAH